MLACEVFALWGLPLNAAFLICGQASYLMEPDGTVPFFLGCAQGRRLKRKKH
jgi:hypothetical protein